LLRILTTEIKRGDRPPCQKVRREEFACVSSAKQKKTKARKEIEGEHEQDKKILKSENAEDGQKV